jgi:polar amino acid transport system substrate-binding protein
MTVGRAVALLCGMFACVQAPADTLAPITMHYYERKPLHYLNEHNQVAGLIVTPIEQSFAKAGIPIKWQQTPVNRIVATLQANDGLDCAAGWYKSPDRESYLRFSQPVYRDKGLVALSRSDFSAPPGVTARELLSRPQTRLVVKQGFFHGRYLEPLIEKMPPAQVQRVSDEISSMVKMVRVGVADIIILTEDEVDVYIDPASGAGDGIRVLHLPDVPTQEYRYVACSKKVPQQIIDRLNAAISSLALDGAHTP